MGGQAGFMFAAVLVAFTISVVGGAITGMFKIREYSTKSRQKYEPILCHWPIFIPPENIREIPVF